MKRSCCRLSCLFLIFFALILSIKGQEARAKDPPSGKIIQVISADSRPAAPIVLRTERSSGFWGSNFPRIKDWQQPANEQPAQVLNFEANLIGDKAEVIVSVFKGRRFGEIHEPVGTFILGEGESAKVSGITRYGFEPLTLKFIAVPNAIADVPLVSNPSASLRTIVSPIVATVPTINVKLINDSTKAIMALSWHTVAGKQIRMVATPQGRYGKPLIGANGGEYELAIPEERPGNFAGSLSFVIQAVIYEDGSVEGDASVGAGVMSGTRLRKQALTRLVPLLQAAAQARSEPLDLPALIAQVDAVTEGGGTSETVVAKSRPIGGPFAAVISELLKKLRALDEQSAKTPAAAQRKALMDLATLYREWLERLSK